MAVDMFLKLTGIKGESRDAKHAGEIDIESFSWGVSQAAAVGGAGAGGAGKVSFQDFSFVMRSSAAGAPLFGASASGQHIKEAILTCRKAGGNQMDFLKVTLSDVLVSSYTQASGGAESLPMDQISLNYSKIEIDYVQQQPDGSAAGSVRAGWDLKANKKV